jgi:predicted nucleic acid-binding protein
MTFADTNWLVAMFFSVPGRSATVARFLRRHTSALGLSPIVLLEARNVFSRESGEAEPEEWRELEQSDHFYRDPMNWDLLRRDVFALAARYAHKAPLGALDLAVLASARLGGARQLLSFDETLKALAAAEGLEVFPDLQVEGRAVLANLRR